MEGFWVGTVILFLVTSVIDLLSGNFGRAATAGTLLVFCVIMLAHSSNKRKNDPNEKTIMDFYHKEYPGWTDEQIYAYRRQKQKELQKRMNQR